MRKKNRPRKIRQEADSQPSSSANADVAARPKEVGGRRDGLDPTRYGDWEKAGRCIDF